MARNLRAFHILIASFAGVIVLMILAIVFEGLSAIVKITGELLSKTKLDIGVAVLQLFAGMNFILTCCTASDLKLFGQ